MVLVADSEAALATSQLSTNIPWNMANTRWASILNPIIANPLTNVNILTNIALKSGVNVINTGLQQIQQGWLILDQQGPASIYRSADFNKTTLTLTSSAAVTVSLGVFEQFYSQSKYESNHSGSWCRPRPRLCGQY